MAIALPTRTTANLLRRRFANARFVQLQFNGDRSFLSVIISALHGEGDLSLMSVDFTAVGEAIALPKKSPVASDRWCRWASKRNNRRSLSPRNHLYRSLVGVVDFKAQQQAIALPDKSAAFWRSPDLVTKVSGANC